jgi:hypothetical protein
VAKTSPKKTTGKGSKASRKTATKSGGSKTLRSSATGRLVVSPRSDGWGVKRTGGSRERRFDTKVDAVKAAAKTARNSKSEVVIKGKDGRIMEVSSSRADSLMLDVWQSTRQDSLGSRNPQGTHGAHSRKK